MGREAENRKGKNPKGKGIKRGIKPRGQRRKEAIILRARGKERKFAVESIHFLFIGEEEINKTK